MSTKDTKAHYIGSKLIVKTFLHDDLTAKHRDRAWEDGRLYLMLDPQDPVVRYHRTDRVIIPDDKVAKVLSDDGFAGVNWSKPLGSTKVTGNLYLISDTTVRLVVKLMNFERDDSYQVVAEAGGVVTKAQDDLVEITGEDGAAKEYRLYKKGRSNHILMRTLVETGKKVKAGAVLADAVTEGLAMIELSVLDLARAVDVQKLCLPMAGQAYRTLRGALYRGAVSEIGVVQRGLENRFWQLGNIPRVQDPAFRAKLNELLAANDAFFETLLHEVADPAVAIELIDHHIAGNVSVNEELEAKVHEERERLAEEAERAARAITTVEDMQQEKERERQRRAELKARRSKRIASNAVTKNVPQDEAPIDSEEVTANVAETESVEIDDRETEGSPEAPLPEHASTHLTERQKKIYANEEAKKLAADAPAPEAPKAKEKAAPKNEEPELDWKAKLDALKAQVPAAETDKTE